MDRAEGQQRARVAVRAEMTHRGWDHAALARRANVGAETVSDLVNGRRWPKPSTRGKIERALGWPPDMIERIVDGEQPPPLGGDPLAQLGRIHGLTQQERADIQVRIIELLGIADDRALRAAESVLRTLSEGNG